jgi:hypothetical protein
MAEWSILGGGVSGCIAAMELAKRGHQVTLFEKEPQLGGFFKNVTLDGLVFDIGTILLYSNNPLFSTFDGLLERMIPASSIAQAIRKPRSFDRYPMSLAGYVRDFGVLNTAVAVADVALSKVRHKSKADLDSYIRYYIGRRFYENGGLRNYIERLYQLPVDEIDIEFSRQRLSYLGKMAGIRHQIKKRLKKKKVAHKCFVRPKAGFGVLFSIIQGKLEAEGVKVNLGQAVHPNQIQGKRILSTLPLKASCNWLGVPFEAKADSIRLLTLFYKHTGGMGFNGPVLFNYSPAGRWKRVTVFSRFYGLENGSDYFAVECTLKPTEQDVLSLRDDFEAHGKSLGLIQGALHFLGHHITEGAYPVYRKNEIEKIRQSQTLIEGLGVTLIGRQASHDFASSDDVGRRAVEWARNQ